jgi:predicted O-methyltransferase YrrM
MVIEVEMLKESEWWQFDRKLVDEVAFPVGDRYPQEIFDRYFSIYGGLVKKWKPKRVLEIGVRYGYTAIVMWEAAGASGQDEYEYIGIDDESYPPAPGVTVGSCTKANENFAIKGCEKECHAFRWNSFDGIPAKFGTFDVVHIDGNHDKIGVLNDLGHCWPILNVGGIIILDDLQMPPIKDAVDEWLTSRMDMDEVIAVQFIEDERGHCLIRKTGLAGGPMEKCPFDLGDPNVKLG